jgi:hypothetical protein
MIRHDDNTKQLFLDTLSRTGVIADAMRAAGISQRLTVSNWRKDEQFDDAYRDALADAGDGLELEAHRRAVEGVVKVRFSKDGTAYDEIAYSDTLLLALLKAKKPHEFAERTKTEITSPDGSLTPENPTASAARLLAILEEAKLRRAAETDPLFL